MPDDRFLSFFRLSLPAFTALQSLIRTDNIFQNNSYNKQADPAIQLACALYHFGQYGNSTVRAAEQLEIGEGTTRLYVYRTTIALLRQLPHFLIWPSKASQSYRDMRRGIEDSCDFTGCVGFVDGCDINLQYAPSYHGDTYMNRKKNYAINIQGICNAERRFTYVSSGYPASVGDPSVFATTDFFRFPYQFFAKPDEYILGDKIYRITRRCVTPYKDPLGRQREGGYRWFNWSHAHARVKIEHSFGILKNRFRSLQCLPIKIRSAQDHCRAVGWIMACVVLHNFCHEQKEDATGYYQPEAIVLNDEDAIDNVDQEVSLLAERQAGNEWRDRIREHLYNNRPDNY